MAASKKIIKCNKQFYECLNSKKKIKIFQGGTRSGKTYAICQYLIHLLLSEEDGKVITIARKTLPAVKSSVFRDFMSILDQVGILHNGYLNKSEMIYYYKNHKCEFISVDEPQKIRGRKRDILFVNEGNELSFEDFRQLIMRTSQQVILDFNPSDPIHWIYDELMTRDDSETFISTYKDNAFLEKQIVDEIERLKDKDEQYWSVYGEGKRATFAEGMVFNNWEWINYEDFPETDDIFLGLDFGYTNDPTAIVELRKKNDKIYIKEICYKTGMTNQDIANFLKANNYSETIIYCDSAEPKSIDELRSAGIMAKPSIKGQGSIAAGISLIKEYYIYACNVSKNLKNEYQFYIWEELKDGTKTNKPRDKFNHLIDALRYGIYTRYSNKADFFVV
jgi:phage terminase large subunit